MSARPRVMFRATRRTWAGNESPCVIVGAYTSRVRFIRYALRRALPGSYVIEREHAPGAWAAAGDAYVRTSGA